MGHTDLQQNALAGVLVSSDDANNTFSGYRNRRNDRRSPPSTQWLLNPLKLVTGQLPEWAK